MDLNVQISPHLAAILRTAWALARTMALASILKPRNLRGRTRAGRGTARPPAGAAFRAKAKRVIYLFMSGGPSHIDLFDYKRSCASSTASNCRPPSAWTAPHRHDFGPDFFPCVARCSIQATRSERDVGERAVAAYRRIVDDVRDQSMNTEAINHDPP